MSPAVWTGETDAPTCRVCGGIVTTALVCLACAANCAAILREAAAYLRRDAQERAALASCMRLVVSPTTELLCASVAFELEQTAQRQAGQGGLAELCDAGVARLERGR